MGYVVSSNATRVRRPSASWDSEEQGRHGQSNQENENASNSDDGFETESTSSSSTRSLRAEIRRLRKERRKQRKASNRLSLQLCKTFDDLMTRQSESQQATAVERPNKPNVPFRSLRMDYEWARSQDGFKVELQRIKDKFREVVPAQEANILAFANFMRSLEGPEDDVDPMDRSAMLPSVGGKSQQTTTNLRI